jgi:hypothetical protein
VNREEVPRTVTGARPPDESGIPPTVRDYGPTYAAFLDQGRWLLSQQQSRGSSFQGSAVALLGFVGVVLGVLATNQFLAGSRFWAFSSIVGRVGVLLLAASAYAAVRVVTPRRTGTIVMDDTLDDWENLFEPSSAGVPPYEAAKQFAHMLLARDPQLVDSTASGIDAAQRRSPSARKPKQVILDAAETAEHRSLWTTRAAWLLLGAVLALVLVILVPNGDAPALDLPGPSGSATQQAGVPSG